ncbi:MAG: hypothetical protein H6974_14365 [Gammaproteobacteria bacterium]|nr:hypothetical protein [Gammaproteobacteria bacterium]
MTDPKMIGRVFKIVDCHDREWGSFTVSKETWFFDTYHIHGFLTPSDDFRFVKSIFAQHEKEMAEDGDVGDISVNEIVDLKPHLVDIQSHEIINIQGALFVSGNLLVTCGIEHGGAC